MHRFILWSRGALLLFLALLLLALPGAGIRAQTVQDDVEAASAKAWVGKKAKGFHTPFSKLESLAPTLKQALAAASEQA